MTEAGASNPEADHAVSDHDIVQHGHLLLQKLVAFALHDEEFKSRFSGRFQQRRKSQGL